MHFIQASEKTQLDQIEALYEKSFPKSEKKPFSLICEKQAAGMVDILYIQENDDFCGLAITMKNNDLVLLDYFAIAPEKHGMGCGSAALQQLFRYYEEKRFFLEIETTKEEADNMIQRQRRKRFYLKNDMTELGIDVVVFGTNMELLGHNISLTPEEYLNVYQDTYGRNIAKNVQISTFLI